MLPPTDGYKERKAMDNVAVIAIIVIVAICLIITLDNLGGSDRFGH